MRVLVIVSTMAVFLACKGRPSLDAGIRRDGRKPTLSKVCDERSFELTVQVENARTVMAFRYPDLGGRVAVVSTLSISKIEGEEAKSFCRLLVKDWMGAHITSTWVVGTVPPNYSARGCSEAEFGPGNYQVVVGTDRFDVSRRMHVGSEGEVEILDWDDWTQEECEALRKTRRKE